MGQDDRTGGPSGDPGGNGGDRLGRTRPRDGLRGVLKLVTLALGAAAVVKELRTPPERRTWHGTVVGFVPYDFRRPSLARVRQRLWSPHGALLQPHVFGVGWTVNLGRLVALVRSRLHRTG